MRRTAWIGILAALLAGPGLSQPAPTPRAEAFVRLVFAEVEGRPIDCPQTLERFGGSDEAVCVGVDLGWHGLKKRIDRLIRNKLPQDHNTAMAWGRDLVFRSRYYIATDRSLRLLYDDETSVLAVLPGHPCFAPPLAARAWKTDGELERVHYVRPDYPEQARVKRSDGQAYFEALVQTDGSVDGVCVLSVDPAGMGFESAGIGAILDWRYKPVLVRGVPSETPVIIKLDWSIQPLG